MLPSTPPRRFLDYDDADHDGDGLVNPAAPTATPFMAEDASGGLGYWALTRTRSYNFLFAGVLLILYELLTWAFVDRSQDPINLIDSLFESVLQLHPNLTLIVSGVLVTVGVVFVGLDWQRGVRMRGKVFGMMWLESWVWAGLIFVGLPMAFSEAFSLLNSLDFNSLPAAVGHGSYGNQLILSLGAGFYEELFFRLLMVQALMLLLRVFDLQSSWFGVAGVILASAVLFSLAHHIAEPFTFGAFFYRTAFGLLMSMLLVFRGFGITAWAHALYDVLVFTFASPS
jgi:membrane protease YdiL (CAAX protease family)